MITAAAAGFLASAVHAQPMQERVPAGSVVLLELGEDLSSKTAKRGDTFAIRLARPIMLGDVVVVPAGTPGRGEVIEADTGRGKLLRSFQPTKLVLAARYLELNGARIPLRALHMSAARLNGTDTLLIGPHGVAATRTAPTSEAELAAGSSAEAKLAVDLDPQGGIIPPAN
jgi:hypothetical protein